MGLFSAIYGLGLNCKKYIDIEIKKPARLPSKVISIGNITLGGTGKTPAVINLAREAKKRRLNPCVLTRGYKGKAKDTCFISKGEGPVLDTLQAGDEAWLMADKLRGVPVVKGSDRFKAGIFPLENDQCALCNLQSSKLFILDDGFQHWKLHRDIDVVLIDATNPFGNRRLFPEGIMREPFNALERADIFVITKSDMAGKKMMSDITADIRHYNSKAPLYSAFHKPSGTINAAGEINISNNLRDKKTYAFSGIANPAYFQATLRSMGADIINFRKFRDHHLYSQKEIDDIRKDSMGLNIVTTEKDLVKLRELQLPDRLSALRIEFSIEDGFYDYLFNLLENR